MYLAMFEAVISAVLIKQDRANQHSVYYISYLFKRAKLCYINLKKLTSGLILAARRLRPYFLSHPIVVMIDTPLECMLTHLEVTR